ncbi:MAG: DMT family transporter [bacterium]
MPKARFKYPVIFIIIAAILWSLDAIVRRSLYVLPAPLIVFWEHSLGLIFMLPLVPAVKRSLKKFTKAEWLALVVTGVLSGAVATILYTAALAKVNFIPFSAVVLMQQLQPIWAITAAYFLLQEKISKRFLPWAILAMIGAFLVSFKDLSINWQNNSQTIIAAIYALLAGVIWGASTSTSKILLKEAGFLEVLFLRFVIAAITSLIIYFFQGGQVAGMAITPTQIISLLIVTLSAGAVGTGIYYYGLRHTPARISTIAELAWPASAFLIGIFYFHESYSLTQIIGMIILIFGIFQVVKIGRR